MDLINSVNKNVVDRLCKLIIDSSNNLGRPIKNLQLIVSAILYKLKTGCQWSMLIVLPYSWKSVYHHFNKWTKLKLFIKFWKTELNNYQTHSCNKYNVNLKELSVDTTKIKNVNGSDKLGTNSTDRGRRGNKISTVVDKRGITLSYNIEPANLNDITILPKTLTQVFLKKNGMTKLFADKAYRSKNETEKAALKKYNLIAPIKRNEKDYVKTSPITDKRYIVEASYSWIKNYKQLILRYDRYVDMYESFLCIALVLIMATKLRNL